MNDRASHLLSNQPPLVEAAALEIEERLHIDTPAGSLEERKTRILDSLERVQVTDHETTGSAGDFISIAKLLLADVDGERRSVKRPYDDAGDAVQNKVAGFIEPIQQAIFKVEGMISDFRSAERERARKAAQEQRDEENRLREAAAAARAKEAGTVNVRPAVATAPFVAPSEISLPVARGNYGSKVKDKRKPVFKIIDPCLLPTSILESPMVQEAMLRAIAQLHKLQKTIPGVEISYETGEQIRKGGR